MSVGEDIAEVLRPAVQAAGLEIWDVERSPASLRVVVERSGGVDLDTISALSRTFSAVLDRREDLAPRGRYTLEVSSPGLERRLRTPEHFVRCVGSRVAIRTTESLQGTRRFSGTLVAANADSVVIRPEGPDAVKDPDTAVGSVGGHPAGGAHRGEELEIPLMAIERARTVFEWSRPAPNATSRRAAKGGRA
ncbi:MAG TPA: ribosome maturation factor RimP [Acidimicrobiales bacterium]|nr:ribosome maturation factor RimP [Acidimicrobiales bacterium]